MIKVDIKIFNDEIDANHSKSEGHYTFKNIIELKDFLKSWVKSCES